MSEKGYYITHLRLLLIITPELSSFEVIEDDSHLFPRIDVMNRNICFSNSTPAYLALLQFGSPNLATLYLLLFKAASHHQYELANQLIEKAEKLFLEEKLSMIPKCQQAGAMITCEMLFLFYHEIAHGIFATNKVVKDDYFKLVPDSDIHFYIDNTLTLFRIDNDSLKKRLYELSVIPARKEEMAADIYAIFKWLKYAENNAHGGLQDFHFNNLLFSVLGVYLTHSHFQNLELYMADKNHKFDLDEEFLLIYIRKFFIVNKISEFIRNQNNKPDFEEVQNEIEKILNLNNFQDNCVSALKEFSDIIENIKDLGTQYSSRRQRDGFKEKIEMFNSQILDLPEVFPPYKNYK